MVNVNRTRDRWWFLAIVLGFSVVMSACSGENSDSSDGVDSDGRSTAGQYPVTMDSAYGEIVVDEKPENILVIGAQYVDMLAAIEEEPVAFAGAGEQDEEELLSTTPWMSDLRTGQFDPRVVTADYKVDPEVIAQYEPDLIVGQPYYIEEEHFEQLSAIAPTYVSVFSPDRDWTDDLRDLGTLTDKEEAAEEAIADVDDRFSEARGALAGLQGRTFNLGWYTAEGLRMPPAFHWVEDLGLRNADNQPGEGEQAKNLARENLSQFAGDIAFVQADDEGRAALESDARFRSLPASRNDSLFFVDRPVIDAALTAGPRSMEWLLSEIVPLLESSPLNVT